MAQPESKGVKVKSSLCTLTLYLYLFSLLLWPTANCEGGGVTSASDAYPQFNIQDLANLMDMFPEFREYVLNVLKGHIAEKTSAAGVTPVFEDFKDARESRGQDQEVTVKKTGWGWTRPKDYGYHYHDSGYKPKGYGYSHHHHHHDYKGKGYGYSWSPPPPPLPPPHYHHHHYGWGKGHAHGWGWPQEELDPKFHYQVGYELGKDLSCILGFFGFKSIKDITVFSVFSVLKKLKIVFIFLFAFKLGLLMSPLLIPLLFPIIIISVAVKVIPLILIICFLFKLLKAKIKVGLRGREHYGWARPSYGPPPVWYEDMQVDRLWNSIENVTQTVTDSENCVDKIICKIVKEQGTGRGMDSAAVDLQQRLGAAMEEYPWMSKVMEFYVPSQWERKMLEEGGNLECSRIPCPYLDNPSL